MPATTNTDSSDISGSWLCPKCKRWQMHQRNYCMSEYDTGIPCDGQKPGSSPPSAAPAAFEAAAPAPRPPAPEKTSRAAEIRQDRAKTYGPARSYARATALVIQGLLEAHYQQPLPGPIPDHVLMFLFAGFKLTRMCFPFEYNPDSHVDAHNYIDLGNEIDARRSNGKNPDDRG
jgi:hypothetical protein